MDWDSKGAEGLLNVRLLGTLVLVLLPGFAGWAWARHANRFGSGRAVVHESASLVVCDEHHDNGVLRMLLFKSQPTLRQSEVTIGASGAVKLSAKTPLHSHVNRAMALGLALLPFERRQLLCVSEERGADSDPLTIAVVGAGACILPGWLCSLSPHCRVAAVECSSEVIEAAQHCFGLESVPATQLKVYVEEGVSFVERCAHGTYDAMLVTAGSQSVLDGDAAGEQLAPPASMTEKHFVAAALRALRPAGLYVVNILCRTERKSVDLVKKIRQTVVDAGFSQNSVHVAKTGAWPHRNFVLFATAPAANNSTGNDATKEVSAAELVARYTHCISGSPPRGCVWVPWSNFASSAMCA